MTFSLCLYFTWHREDNPFHPLSNYFSLNLLTSGLHPFSSDHVKVTNSRSKSYTLFKLKNYWERRYRCREHTKNVIILRVKDEAYLIALDCKLFVNRWHYQLVPQHIIFAEKERIHMRYATSVRINISFSRHSLLSDQ